jgi:hypothetical protein
MTVIDFDKIQEIHHKKVKLQSDLIRLQSAINCCGNLEQINEFEGCLKDNKRKIIALL